MSGRIRTFIKVCQGYLLGKYSTEVFGEVRYGLNTLLNTPVWFGSNPIPVPDTLVSSVRPPKIPRVYTTRYRILGDHSTWGLRHINKPTWYLAIFTPVTIFGPIYDGHQ